MAKAELIAHRGASLLAPENSLAAFELAAQFGADWIELDVQLSADGEAIVFHDDELERMTGTSAAIGARPAQELCSLKLLDPLGTGVTGETIPTLREVLARIDGPRLYIEIKSDGGGIASARNLELLDRCCELVGSSHRHALASFDVDLVGESLRRDQPSVLIFSDLDSPQLLSPDERRALLALSARGDLLDRGAVDLARTADCSLWAWTLDGAKQMNRAMRLGVHGICSNDTVLARTVIDSWSN